WARYSTITALAFREQAVLEDEAVALIAAACRILFGTGKQDFDERLASYSGTERLWPALARHLIGRASANDREMLEHVANDVNHGDSVLRAGLKYYVRGDVALEHETIMLDELCHRKLPFVEDAVASLRRSSVSPAAR